MNIEQLRRNKRNEVYNTIATLEKRIERCMESIPKLRNSGFDSTFVSAQIEKKENTISSAETEIEELKYSLSEINHGEYDQELLSSVTHAAKKSTEKKRSRGCVAVSSPSMLQSKRKEQIKDYRQQRQHNRDIKYEYRRYLRNVDSLPPYMEKNLSEMPAYKAYRYKGILFFGKKDYTGTPPFTILEKKGNTVIITEWHPEEVLVYHKTLEKRNFDNNRRRGKQRRSGGNKPVLVSRQARRKRTREVSLMDYVKK